MPRTPSIPERGSLSITQIAAMPSAPVIENIWD